jgi:SAM-dependent methyltransferase
MLSANSDAISHIAQRAVELSKTNPKASKPSLIAILDFESSVDRAVNQIANHYYQGKHPKHYLWTSHNDFIIDNVEPGERVIDIGCGASQYTLKLAEKGAKILGVDINPERIETIKRNNVHPNLDYAVINLEEKLPEERFDTAVCSHILEHMDKPVEFLIRLRSIASKVIIKVPRVDSGWKKLMKKDLGIFWLDDADHKREYTEELKGAGWNIVKFEKGLDLRAVAESY